MLEYKVLLAGDTALVVEFGDRIDLRVSAKVLSLSRRLNELRIDGIVETVPTIRSLIVYYEPLTLSTAALQRKISELMQDLKSTESPLGPGSCRPATILGSRRISPTSPLEPASRQPRSLNGIVR